ncbi:MAG TPA: Ig-like domain-containing protein [Gemmatimonadales bacterium]|nr:Ig-like domain-containing protein [Gemmatimonadales bacterium]
MRLLRAVLTHGPVLAAVACGGGDLVLPSDGGPARIVIIQGNEQTGSAGAALDDSLVVRITDGQDRAISGLRVAFTLSGGGGEVSPDTVVTDGGGRAGAEWVLGAGAGAQAVDAEVVGEALTVRFTASAGSGAASRMVLVSGDDQSAAVGTALSDSLVVRVEDAFGNPVAGVSVEWTAAVGEVSPATAVSDGDGLAAARRILGAVAGEQTTTASADGLAGSPVVFTHTAVPGTAASLVLISGSGQTGPPGEELPDPLVVRLVDESGNGIPSQAVTWVVATGGGSVDPGTSLTDGEGFASARWTLGSATGANTLNAVVSGVGVVGFTATSSSGGGGGGPGPSASQSTISADPTSIQAITGISTITVTVRNGSGAPLAGATVSLQASGSGNTLTQPAGVTGADGIATGTLQSTVPGTKVVSAQVDGSVDLNQTAQVTVSPAPATRVELVEGDGQSADVDEQVPVRPAVRVTNDLGQPIAGFGVTFVVTGGGGSVTGASQTTNSDGVARVGSWTLGPVPGTNTLEARAGSLQGSPVVFTAQGVSAPDRLAFRVQPGDVEEDEEFSPPVEVAILDGAGNIVPLSGIEIRIDLIRSNNREDNGRLEGDRTVETVDGVAVFPDLRVDREDDGYRLRASAPDLPGVEPVLSEPFEVDD